MDAYDRRAATAEGRAALARAGREYRREVLLLRLRRVAVVVVALTIWGFTLTVCALNGVSRRGGVVMWFPVAFLIAILVIAYIARTRGWR